MDQKIIDYRGSIGAGSTPGRVYPGKKMAGHAGNRVVTKNSEVLFLNPEEQILVLKGSLPGKQDAFSKSAASRLRSS